MTKQSADKIDRPTGYYVSPTQNRFGVFGMASDYCYSKYDLREEAEEAALRMTEKACPLYR